MALLSLCTPRMKAAHGTIEHVHPLHWWAGMRNPELQILLHGQNIRDCEVTLSGTEGVDLKEIVRLDSPNYLLLYMDTRHAPAQKFHIELKSGRKKLKMDYELKSREAAERHTFDAADVVYLLMPDRFANGSEKTDVVKGMRETVCDSKLPDARHGGDLAGMEQHLGYLAELGVTAVWHTPTLVNDMPESSYHGYAITDYYQTDPRYGSNEEYRHFVDTAHRHGIKVIKDIVFNHCGSMNFLFLDRPSDDWFNYGDKYVQTSYKTGTVSDIHASELDCEHTVAGWFVESMPDLNQRNRYVRDYLRQASIWWIEYAGIDGIRQDTYPYCDFDAMRQWCLAVDAEYPGFNIVGETWVNNNVGVAYWQKGSKLSAPLNSELPTVMDFPLMSLLNSVVDEETNEWDKGLACVYEYISQDIVYADPLHLLIFLDNHDTDRFQKDSIQAHNIDRYKQALTMLLTLRGIPQLYYGDEIGMYANKSKGDGALRKNFPGGWATDKRSAFTEEGRTKFQKRYFDFTRTLLQWRKTCPAVAYGTLRHFHIRNGVYVYSREFEGRTVTVALNGTDKPVEVDLSVYAEVLPKNYAYEVLAGKTVAVNGGLKLEKRGIRVWDFGR
ncbi:MAG: glycoside hydrolase family 13 protein [Bacteroides sp.]|nr:glycoside hydrolase family 13 protein [Roseburia sp.]MCM1346180.1 glycoside hydrolase family 13 protein [Bacteroides sp.]MCM1420683.1 glycoside hydrolase family 13 protein [Bacteroides sp.]